MNKLISLGLVPLGTAIAAVTDPASIEAVAKFYESHREFCLLVGALWAGRSVAQWWVMQSHQTAAAKAAEMSLLNKLGGVDAILAAGRASGVEPQPDGQQKLSP